MYCQYCGTKNDDNSRFCESCGKPLEGSSQISQTSTSTQRPQPVHIQPGHIPGQSMTRNQIPIQGWQTQGMMPPTGPMAQAARKPTSRSTVIIMIEIVLLLVVVFLCYNQIQTLSDPETVVNSYMEAVAQQDWEEAYSYLDLPSSPFLNLEAYRNYMEASGMNDITDYSVDQASRNSRRSGRLSEFEVSYITKENAYESTLDVQLIKRSEKKWKLIDDWKISLQNSILDNIEINAAPILEVKIDGVLLNDETTGMTNSGDQVTYNLSEIFSGTHLIEVSGPCMEPYRNEIMFVYGGDYVQMWLPHMSEEQLQILGQKSAEYWGKLMEGVAHRMQVSDMPGELQDSYQDAAWTLVRRADEDYSYITHMENRNPTVILDSFEYLNGRLQANITMKTDMKVTGVVETSSASMQRTYQGIGTMNAIYYYEDGEWILDEYEVSYSNN